LEAKITHNAELIE